MKALDLYRFQEIFIRIKDLQIFRSSHRRCPETCNFIKKETPSQVFSCEFCEISNNTFFTEHLWIPASVKRMFTLKFLYDESNFFLLYTKACSTETKDIKWINSLQMLYLRSGT